MQEAQTWDVVRAREHGQCPTKYRRYGAPWTGSKRQAFELAEADFLYYATAFHEVHPATRLSEVEAAEYMTESWRLSNVLSDLRFFKCYFCRQFAKHGFCEQVQHHVQQLATVYALPADVVPFICCTCTGGRDNGRGETTTGRALRHATVRFRITFEDTNSPHEVRQTRPTISLVNAG